MNLRRIQRLNEEMRTLLYQEDFNTSSLIGNGNKYLVVKLIEGGFIPNTNIEYDSQIILYDGQQQLDSIMFSYENQTDNDIIRIAKDHFQDIPDNIKVEWN